jgi:hypothetical protein
MLAMLASDAPEEPHAPSKKLLNLSAFAALCAASIGFIALPVTKIYASLLATTLLTILTPLSWLAPICLALTLFGALIFQSKK